MSSGPPSSAICWFLGCAGVGMVSKENNRGRKHSQRTQIILHKYYPILELFYVVNTHGYSAFAGTQWVGVFSPRKGDFELDLKLILKVIWMQSKINNSTTIRRNSTFTEIHIWTRILTYLNVNQTNNLSRERSNLKWREWSNAQKNNWIVNKFNIFLKSLTSLAH